MALQSLSQSQIPHHPGRELGLYTTAMHIQHILVANAMKCSTKPEATLLEMDRHVSTTEESLLQAAAHADWLSVSQYLAALSNSQLERHTDAVNQLLETHQDLPKFVMNEAKDTLGRLTGDAAKQTLISLLSLESSDEASEAGADIEALKQFGMKYEWEFKSPADGTHGAPDPKFQSGAKFEAGANAGTGLSASLKFPVKFWKKAWTFDAVTVKVETPEWSGLDPKPVFTICAFGCKEKIYTYPDQGKKEDAEEGDDEADEVGRCGTDVSKKKGKWKGLTLSFTHDLTFFKYGVAFAAGPIPLNLEFSVAGALTLDAGVGLLGGDGKKVCEKDGDNKLCSTKGITCGDGKTLSKGQLLFVRPSAEIALSASGAVTFGAAEAGIEIKVTLLEIKVPITLEANMGGTVGASSTSLQLQIGAGSGSVSAYAKVWAVGREDWEIFSWDGAETTYPDEGNFLGDYSDKVGIPKRTFKMKDPLETECLVVLYPVLNGKGGDVNKRYALQAGGDGTQKPNSLPQDVQDSTKSARTFGACDFVEFVDDDYGDASYGDSNSFWIGGVDYNNLPDDVESDVFKLGITTTPTGRYNNRWTRKDCCAFASFSSPNHVGKEWFQFDCDTADASNTYNAGEDNAWGDNDLDLDSALFASSCSGVNLKEQDGSQNWFTSKDVGDMAGMPDDYVDDVYRVVLSIGSAEELLDVSTVTPNHSRCKLQTQLDVCVRQLR